MMPQIAVDCKAFRYTMDGMAALPLVIEQLLYRYPGAAAPAVDRLNLTLSPGEILGLLGPNGAGKTTTLHAVLGLLQPAAGTVRVFGALPMHQRLQVLARLNFASVDVDLPTNLTAQECLMVFARLYGLRAPHARVEALVNRLQLSAIRTHLIGTFSAGERMRLKLCKALLNDPDLLILDEPTLSLDPYMAQQVRTLLREIQRQRGMSILYTSHNMQEVETFCDRILFLHQGRTLAEGSPAEVLARCNSRSLDELFIRVATSGEVFHVG